MADSVRLNIDTTKLSDALKRRLELIANPDTLIRPVVFDLIALMTERVHLNGLAADGGLIKPGGYSEGYLAIRQKKYNRTADKKVILSLTRQLENDWAAIAIKNGYGIGFKNTFNYDKAGWMEELFDKPIFKLSVAEREYAQKRFEELFQQAMQ